MSVWREVAIEAAVQIRLLHYRWAPYRGWWQLTRPIAILRQCRRANSLAVTDRGVHPTQKRRQKRRTHKQRMKEIRYYELILSIFQYKVTRAQNIQLITEMWKKWISDVRCILFTVQYGIDSRFVAVACIFLDLIIEMPMLTQSHNESRDKDDRTIVHRNAHRCEEISDVFFGQADVFCRFSIFTLHMRSALVQVQNVINAGICHPIRWDNYLARLKLLCFSKCLAMREHAICVWLTNAELCPQCFAAVLINPFYYVFGMLVFWLVFFKTVLISLSST